MQKFACSACYAVTWLAELPRRTNDRNYLRFMEKIKIKNVKTSTSKYMVSFFKLSCSEVLLYTKK